ncbi:MAG: AI-2E family transporter [Candidatus Krumholzibacteriota bacterium]|nr:AI-2E family transporter [Candidatus Krumholzibacteriota bacterium]
MTDRSENRTDEKGGGEFNLNRRALIVILFLVSGLFLAVVRSFLVSILLASTLVTLLYPIYKKIQVFTHGRNSTASIITCFMLLLCLFLPMVFLALHVADQAVDLYENARPRAAELLEGEESQIVKWFKGLRFYGWMKLDSIDWQETLQKVAGKTGAVSASVINKTSKGLFDLLTSFFVIFLTMFFFFRDGERILSRLKYLSPLKDEYERLIFKRFVEISRATVRGTFLIGLIQGAAGTLILLFFGFKSWLLLGVIMAIFSIIPVVGAWIILIPAGAIRIFTGDIWQGVVIVILTGLVVSTVDNLLRPRLVGRETGMHDLLVFFSTLGGISVFGISGFIVGPVIAALFLTVVEIWGEEFASSLKA